MTKEKLSSERQATIEYHRSNGWHIVTSKLAPVVFAYKMRGEKVDLKAWRGQGGHKPSFYYAFSTRPRAELYANEFVRQEQGRQSRRAAQVAERSSKRAKLKAEDHWNVGDTVYTSWGYDQTNIEFFQIVELKARSVVVRQVLENNSDHGQPGGGRTAPRRYEYTGPEILCPLDENGRFSAGPCWDKDRPSYRHSCYKWEGRAMYTSSDH
jgi:hypothetical protein